MDNIGHYVTDEESDYGQHHLITSCHSIDLFEINITFIIFVNTSDASVNASLVIIESIDTSNMCSHLQKKLLEDDEIYHGLWTSIQENPELTAVVRSRQLHEGIDWLLLRLLICRIFSSFKISASVGGLIGHTSFSYSSTRAESMSSSIKRDSFVRCLV